MTNPDQDVTLDEMAKFVVEWMDGWELIDEYQFSNGKRVYHILKLYHEDDGSLDVIREVEEVLEEAGLAFEYTKYVLHKMDDADYENASGWKFLTADSETRLCAIYKTLTEAGEV